MHNSLANPTAARSHKRQRIVYLAAYIGTGVVFVAVVGVLIHLARVLSEEAGLVDAQQHALAELRIAVGELRALATQYWHSDADRGVLDVRLTADVRRFTDGLNLLKIRIERLEDVDTILRNADIGHNIQVNLAALHHAWEVGRLEFSALRPGSQSYAMQAVQMTCDQLQQYCKYLDYDLTTLQNDNHSDRRWLLIALLAALLLLGLLMMWLLWSSTHNRMEILALNMMLERRVAERTAEYEKVNLHLANVQSSICSALVVIDAEHRVTSWNPAAEKLSGISRAQAQGRNILELPPIAGLETFRAALAQALQHSQSAFIKEFALSDAAGQRRYGNAALVPLLGRLAEPRGAVILIDDITQIVQARQELGRKTREVVKTNRTLQRVNDELGQFVYAASHDLRGPLINLSGLIRKLDDTCHGLREELNKRPAGPGGGGDGIAGLLDHDVPKLLARIRGSISKTASILDGLLKYSRTGREEYRVVAVDMEHEVARVVELFATAIEESGAQIYVAELPPARADREAVNKVLANLLGNALKYLSPQRRGEVVIEGQRRGGDECIYRVRDNGVGIRTTDHPRVFKIFERLDPSRSKGEGLGLAIVKKIIERLGGEVGVESEWDRGTTFWFTLPAAEVAAPAAVPENSAAEVNRPSRKTMA